ncbi:MAG: long-chain fatty acid--CoA ligase, partial [Candidatus Margulisiibacteriota bacterium]
DLASIVYTSGSTGLSKGVQLTHGNFLSNVEDIVGFVAIDERDSVLSFLPLSHVLERTVGYYLLIYIGGSIYYAQSIQTVGEDIKLAQPTVMISVPRLFEKIQSKILNSLHGFSHVIFNWALKVGHRYHHLRKKGFPTLWLKLPYVLAEKVVFSKIQQKMGGKLRFCVSGGAPLPQSVGEFFEALGICIIEGYGLTETAPVICCNHPDHPKFGTVGKVLRHVTVKLAQDGELLVKGPNVTSGYYKNPDETKLAFTSDGWFCTGDIAQIDEDGYIKIVGRKKELIVMSTGKKVAPQPLEMLLSSSKYVSQVIVVGEGRNYLTALIVPNMSEVDLYLKGRNIVCDQSLLLSHVDTIRLFKELLQMELGDLAPYKQVKKFTLIAKEFTQEDGELTPTLKIKRHVICHRYATEINEMYGEKKGDD